MFRRSAFAVLIISFVFIHGCVSNPPKTGKKASGITAEQRKKIEKVKKEMKEFPKVSAVVADSFYEQGQFFEERGMDEEALRQYKNALDLRPSFSDMIHYSMGVLYYRQNLLDLAEEHLLEAIDLTPDHLYSHYWLGIVYIEKEEYKEAIREFETVLQINPSFYECHYYLGLAYEKGEIDKKKAVLNYEKYAASKPDGDRVANALAAIKKLAVASPSVDPAAAAVQETKDEVKNPPSNEIPAISEIPAPPPAPVTSSVQPDAPVTEPSQPADKPDNVKPPEPEISPSTTPTEIIPLKQETETKTYTAKEDETLWIIAGYKEIYDDDAKWPFIYEANKDILKGKKKIEKGTVLKIPKLDPSILSEKPAAPEAKAAKKKRPRPKDIVEAPPVKVTPVALPAKHTVADGETLWIIAGYDQYYNDDRKWKLIYEANKEILGEKKAPLVKGLVITIPKPDELPSPIKEAQQAVVSNPVTVSATDILKTTGSIASIWMKGVLGGGRINNEPAKTASSANIPAPSSAITTKPASVPAPVSKKRAATVRKRTVSAIKMSSKPAPQTKTAAVKKTEPKPPPVKSSEIKTAAPPAPKAQKPKEKMVEKKPAQKTAKTQIKNKEAKSVSKTSKDNGKEGKEKVLKVTSYGSKNSDKEKAVKADVKNKESKPLKETTKKD